MPSYSRDRLSCGRSYHYCTDLNSVLENSTKQGFDFICIPLVNPRYKREHIEGPALRRPGPLTRTDMCITCQDWSTLIVCKLSPWLQLDSEVDQLRKISEKSLRQELTLAQHLCIPAILITLRSPCFANLAKIVSEYLQLQTMQTSFWVHVPVISPEDEISDVCESGKGEGDADSVPVTKHDTWKWWMAFRALCEQHKRLAIALELTADLPDPLVMDRWYGEPVRAVIVSTAVFLTNKKGFPVLSRSHQVILQRFFRLNVQVIVSGSEHHTDKGIQCYYQYLEHLHKSQDSLDTVAAFSRGYEDYLQCPLQPLMDNLESQTYEVFEKDPVKYTSYQKAIYLALLDRVPEDEKDTSVQVLMVLGAGRGPIVRAAIMAAEQAKRRVRIYALEKNPNAVNTLENLRDEVWGESVTVVSGDMRTYNPPEKADIFVSELLGSFADNELSPECLDGAQRYLKEDGLSIPAEYTSYFAPLSSSKLWNETKTCKEALKPPEASFETPYVVNLHNVYIVDKPQPLFTFQHPNKDVMFDNTRYGCRRFESPVDVVIHGFAGYFDTRLYGDVMLSTVPETHSPDMFSWFPIYFPIKEPMLVRTAETIEAHFWRCATPQNIWYEWALTSPSVTFIHNAKGRHYTIGL